MKIPVSLIPPLGKTLDQWTLPPPCDPCDASEASPCSPCDASPCSPCEAGPCELHSASEALEVTLAPEASSAGGPTPANDAVRNERVELAAAARALADKHTLKKLQTLARGKGLQIKGSKLAVAERLVQAG